LKYRNFPSNRGEQNQGFVNNWNLQSDSIINVSNSSIENCYDYMRFIILWNLCNQWPQWIFLKLF
jgi:hypothetical protein